VSALTTFPPAAEKVGTAANTSLYFFITLLE
jgi:hypothetical protein